MGRTIAYKRFRKSYYLYYKLQRIAYVEQKRMKVKISIAATSQSCDFFVIINLSQFNSDD